MAILEILKFPDPKLKLVGQEVTEFNSDLQRIYANMLETMYHQDGIGLAATQVDIQLRLFVLDISPSRREPICFINPNIVQHEGEMTWEEGCLSFPGVYAKVKRHAKIKVEFLDLQGDVHSLEASDLLSVCIQHELDHINGVTFFDHLSQLKQKMLRKKLIKMRDKV